MRLHKLIDGTVAWCSNFYNRSLVIWSCNYGWLNSLEHLLNFI
uniref:Uncharacterized protein n=1 Tax=Rhizophora mucronata TaxID=61149 RepID=A0A2P2Q094_RHIMU